MPFTTDVICKSINSINPNQAKKYAATSLTQTTNHFNIPRNLLARMFHELLSPDHNDGRARLPRLSPPQAGDGGQATGQTVPRYRVIGP